MRKKVLLAALAMLLCLPTAWAEAYDGVVVARETVHVEADAGTLAALRVRPGQVVEAGEAIALTRADKVYASQDGTVARIFAEPDDEVDGAVLEILPVERYLIYCTVEGVTSSPEMTLLHSGETLYLRCTKDGSHRGVGVVTQISSAEYQVLTIGGDFYVGETVNLYRDADFTSASRVGIGTAVSNDPMTLESTGRIAAIHVSEGEFVERGELLYEVAGGDSELAAPVSGIVTSVSVAPGDALRQGQSLLTIAPWEQLRLEIQVDETVAGHLHPGDSARLVFSADADETEISAVVAEIAGMSEDGQYAVWIALPDGLPLRLGMTAIVRLD